MQLADRTNAEQLIRQGIAALKAGDRSNAEDLLIKALQADPNNEQGWLWLSGAVQTDEDRRECLERVLELNPQSAAARHGLELLPPATIATPEPPPIEMYAEPTDLNQSLETPAVDTPFTQNPASALMRDESGATAFIIDALGKHRSRNDIIRDLIAHYQCSWAAAEHFMAQVERQHSTTIAAHQSPFLLFMGVVTLIGGIGMVLFCSFSLYSFFHNPRIYNPRVLVYYVAGVVTGVGMILGSLIGMGQTIRSLWK